MEQYYDDVFYFLRGLTLNPNLAEEMTQETFCRALRCIDSFKGELELRVWLCSITQNVLYSHYKKEKKYVSVELPDNFEA